MSEFQTLYALAEIAIAMAGFAAIVVLFKRRSSGAWDRADADRFNGMLLHAMAAGSFCIVPPFLWVFVPDASAVWTISSAFAGVQMLAHAGVVFALPSTSRPVRLLLIVPLGLVVLQLLNVFGLYFDRGFRPYLAAVLWHIFQAGLLFVTLVFVRPEDTDDPNPS
jgi:hypothetical protein